MKSDRRVWRGRVMSLSPSMNESWEGFERPMVWLCGFVKTCSPVSFGVGVKTLIFTITFHFCSLHSACLAFHCLTLWLETLYPEASEQEFYEAASTCVPQTQLLRLPGLWPSQAFCFTYRIGHNGPTCSKVPHCRALLGLQVLHQTTDAERGQARLWADTRDDKHVENCLLTKQRPVKAFTNYPMKRENSSLPRHGPVVCH